MWFVKCPVNNSKARVAEMFCPRPVSSFQWSQADKHHYPLFSFVYFILSSTGIEAIIVIFHGLSKLMRRTKARIKKRENPVFMVRSLAHWVPLCFTVTRTLLCPWFWVIDIFQHNMFHLGMSDSNLAFGCGDFYCQLLKNTNFFIVLLWSLIAMIWNVSFVRFRC